MTNEADQKYAITSGRPTGKTYRRLLTAVRSASSGKTVFFIISRKSQEQIVWPMLMHIIQPAAGAAMIIRRQSKIEFKNGGSLQMFCDDDYDDRRLGQRSAVEIYDLIPKRYRPWPR